MKIRQKKTPDNIALIFENQTLTYQDLNAKANQLAHYLREQGVKADTLVGICLGRSLEMVIGILGILKAGGGYVPIDPGYPPERINYILNDAGFTFCLTQRSLLNELSCPVMHFICLDTGENFSHYPSNNLALNTPPLTTAYVIYTSGSTGKPKGVVVTHDSVVNLLQDRQAAFQLNAQDRICGLTTLSFDIGSVEIYLPLLAGAQLFIGDKALLRDGERLARYLAENQITYLQATPGSWQMLLESDIDPVALREIVCTGEALNQHLANTLIARFGQVWNLFGPTETTIWSTGRKLTADTARVDIGKPLSNTTCYILGSDMALVPAGIVGELYIGGVGLARGYLNRADLTAERFMPNPYGTAGSRLYRTGDLARYLPEGNIEYIGRSDYQIKLRGYRIELGEIENVLQDYQSIHQAIVVLHEEQAADNIPAHAYLLAYVVLNNTADVFDSEEVKIYLRNHLPDYMVPTQFIELTNFPLTLNGKIDREALPAPDALQSTKHYVAPSNEIEQKLVEIWQTVLHVKRVGIADNFFELGGHSLLAMQVLSRIRQVIAKEIPLQLLFNYPTIQTLAGKINTEASSTPLPTLMPAARHEQEILSYAQERLWFIEQYEKNKATYNVPLAWKIHGNFNLQQAQSAWSALVARHDALRTRFVTLEGKGYQIIESEVEWELEVKEAHNAQEETTFLEAAISTPFDLTKAPLMRVCVIKRSAQEHILVLTQHHIITDAWSQIILLREFFDIYQRIAEHRSAHLTPLALQYIDYALWQRANISGDYLEDKLIYWKKQLHDLEPLALPTDFPRPLTLCHVGEQCVFNISPTITQRLKRLAVDQGVSLYMLLLSAFYVLLSKYSGQRDIGIGTPMTNRNQAEIENVVGLFVNTLVIRIHSTGNLYFTELLHQVKNTVLAAYAHQEAPFEKVVEAIVTTRDLSRNPLFDVMLVLQNAPIESLETVGVRLEPLTMATKTAKFDLLLALEEDKEDIRGTLEYSTALFKPQTMQRLLEHFTILLNSLVQNPQLPLSELDYVLAQEKKQLLEDWNQTQVNYPSPTPVPILFEKQVAKTPDNIALEFENQTLTYRALNERANQVAHYLREQGVKADTLVGICLERSLEMVIGILGILKAGGAYVPIDPSHPQERIDYTLNDAGITLGLTQNSLLNLLKKPMISWVTLDTWESFSHYPSMNPALNIEPLNAAYVIYTSGSTGRPKGVVIPHINVSRLFLGTRSLFDFDEQDIWTSFHN